MDNLEWAWSRLVMRISEFKLQRWRCMDVAMCFLVVVMVQLLWCWMLLETLLLSPKKHSLHGVTDKGRVEGPDWCLLLWKAERCVFHICMYALIYIYMKWKKQHLEMYNMESTIPELSWEVVTSMWLWDSRMWEIWERSGRKSHTHRIWPKVRFWSVSSSCKSL